METFYTICTIVYLNVYQLSMSIFNLNSIFVDHLYLQKI